MLLRLFSLIGLMCGSLAVIRAQDAGWPQKNLRQQTLPIAGDTLRFDTLSIDAASFSVENIPAGQYRLFAPQAFLVWLQLPENDSVTLRYRVLPFNLAAPAFRKDEQKIDSSYGFFTHSPPPLNPDSGFVSFHELDYSGSLGRSVSVGSNQDVALNSSFNLQASGYILDSIKIEAALSDNTIPIQPEGNTQRLQEFDQVYIHLQKGAHRLQLGDYNLEKPKGYFMNFFKRVQGIYYETKLPVNKNSWDAFGLSASVAKGQFARNIFNGSEGNQGPYKLIGENGEQFFIVLAGTERVFIDGLLQERGEQADYIIDYNTAEIRFMPRRLITKDSRIQVEFEYQARNYLNSLLYAYNELQWGKKLNIRINAYSNQDAKNQPYLQNLDGNQRRFLAAIGDSIHKAFYPSVQTDTFAAYKILYKMVDTVVDGIYYDSVFVYSTNPDSARYSLTFSFVGAGKGDYEIAATNANGRTYEWKPRVDGQPQGSYEPVILLVTPKLHQLFTLGATYQIDSLKQLYVEGALSNYDPNLFSTIDNHSHPGGAGKLIYAEMRQWGYGGDTAQAKKSPQWKWRNQVHYEIVQERFKAIAPFRNVEFFRDWNLLPDARPEDEQLAGLATALENKRLGTVSYQFSTLQRSGGYEGYRHLGAYNYNKGRWNNGIVWNQLQSQDTARQTRFLRPGAFVGYTLEHWNKMTIGARYNAEHNEIKSRSGDTLLPQSFAFDAVTAYLSTPEEQPFSYGISYTQRRDFLPAHNQLKQYDHSQTIEVNLGITHWQNHRIGITGSYRKLNIDDTVLTALAPEETLLGRLEYEGSWLKRAVILQTMYELGSGQEQKQSYTFVEVPAGQGIYYWIDYNGDGVQQANEFEIGIYPDQKKFIKVPTLTNEYVRVRYMRLSQSLMLEPGNLWKSGERKGWQKFVARLSNQTSIQLNNRLLADAGIAVYNPFIPALEDENIITTQNVLSNTFYFNRSSAVYGLDYNYLYSGSKQLLTYGVESNSQKMHILRLRWNMTQNWTTELLGRNGFRQMQSALNDGRSYRYTIQGVEPRLTWLSRGVLRVSLSPRYEVRENAPEFGAQKAVFQTVNLEGRYSKINTGAITLRGTYTGIGFIGQEGTALAYSLLDGLQPGDNYLWYANWERRIGRGIELSFEYEGRKPGTGHVIHTGRMSLRAIL